jgi:hypothetical protein
VICTSNDFGLLKIGEKLNREIATLEVEAEMIEAHADKLFKALVHLSESRQRQDMLVLAEEEAKTLRSSGTPAHHLDKYGQEYRADKR